MSRYTMRDISLPTPLTASPETAVRLLQPLLPVGSRPKLASVERVPLGMFMSLYKGAFTPSAGVKAIEKVALEAWTRAMSHPELRGRRGQGGALDREFFKFLGVDNVMVNFRPGHWSQYPDLYRKVTHNLVSDLHFGSWDRLAQVLGDLYLHVDMFVGESDGDDSNADVMSTAMYQRLQVWSNLLTLSRLRPLDYMYYGGW